MCVCVWGGRHVCEYMRLYVWKCTSVSVRVLVYIYIYIYIYICVCVCVCACECGVLCQLMRNIYTSICCRLITGSVTKQYMFTEHP